MSRRERKVNGHLIVINYARDSHETAKAIQRRDLRVVSQPAKMKVVYLVLENDYSDDDSQHHFEVAANVVSEGRGVRNDQECRDVWMHLSWKHGRRLQRRTQHIRHSHAGQQQAGVEPGGCRQEGLAGAQVRRVSGGQGELVHLMVDSSVMTARGASMTKERGAV